MIYQEKAKELSEIIGYKRLSEIRESINISKELYEIKVENSKILGSYLWVLGVIFQAGKIEGIREERARKNK